MLFRSGRQLSRSYRLKRWALYRDHYPVEQPRAAHRSPIDTLLIAIAVTRKWVDESAGRQGRMAHAPSARYPIPGPSTSGTSRAIAARLCHRHERTHGARPARIPQLPACAANFSARAAKFPDYARKFPVPLRREFGCKSLNLLAD